MKRLILTILISLLSILTSICSSTVSKSGSYSVNQSYTLSQNGDVIVERLDKAPAKGELVPLYTDGHNRTVDTTTPSGSEADSNGIRGPTSSTQLNVFTQANTSNEHQIILLDDEQMIYVDSIISKLANYISENSDTLQTLYSDEVQKLRVEKRIEAQANLLWILLLIVDFILLLVFVVNKKRIGVFVTSILIVLCVHQAMLNLPDYIMLLNQHEYSLTSLILK